MADRRRVLAVVALAGGLVACTSGGGADPSSAPTTRTPTASASSDPSTPSATPTFTTQPGPVAPTDVEEIVTGLDAPWSIAFVTATEALVSQRDADTIVRVDAAGTVTEVGAVPDVAGETEGGLLGLAFDPATTSSQPQLYVYLTTASDNRILRTTYVDGAFGEFEVVIDGIPASPRHNGGRIAFGPDGMLYVGTGDAGDGANAQDLGTLAGKILRLTPDGTVPADNPFDGSAVFSYGHRNVEGLTFDDTGALWASEFGEDDADELNAIMAGGNYGWPIVEGIAGDDRFTDPVAEWSPSEASPSGLAYAAGTFFLASLRGERLWQVPVTDGVAAEPTAYLDEFGRLRDAVVAPDGSLWVMTNNTDGRAEPREGDDRILRVRLE